MDDLYLDFVMHRLPAKQYAQVVAHLQKHPEDARLVARMRQAVQRLEADAATFEPPPGLAANTVARVAEWYVTASRPEITPASLAKPRFRSLFKSDLVFPAWMRRADAIVAVGIAFVAFGITLAGISKLRAESRALACQDRLRMLHQALEGYGDTHHGRLPQVGTPQVPVAGAFVAELTRAGQYPLTEAAVCPATDPRPDQIQPGYAYTLGYIGPNGVLRGLAREDGIKEGSDWIPIASDLPRPGFAAGLNQPSHPRGQAVLYLNGAVRFVTSPNAGVNGDHIYFNEAGLVSAGLSRFDAVLGGPHDGP